MNRLGGADPWRHMLDAVASEGTYSSAMDLTDSPNAFRDLLHRAWTAEAEQLRETSPCELEMLQDESIWEPIIESLEKSHGDEGRAMAKIIRDNFLTAVTSALRRSARGLIDRELTLRILEVRLEKAAARDRRWPERLSSPGSAVCIGEVYDYRRDGKEMQISFPVAVSDPSSGLVLPLSFHAGKSAASPSP
jgi:hypothetical protein